MAKAKAKGLSQSALTQIALGAFFVVLGIVGIIPQSGEGMFSLSPGRTTLEIVFGVVEALCGAFFLFDAVSRVSRKTTRLVIVSVLALWALRVIISEFVNGIVLRSDGIFFRPNFWFWLLALSVDFLVAAILWARFREE
jgi:hypothetical protein